MDDEKVIAQAIVQKLGAANKNGRVYDWDKATDEQIKNSIEKLQLSSMYGKFGKEDKDIKVDRLDYHSGGFKPGYLYCINRQLENTPLCSKCESRYECAESKERDRISDLSLYSSNSFDVNKVFPPE